MAVNSSIWTINNIFLGHFKKTEGQHNVVMDEAAQKEDLALAMYRNIYAKHNKVGSYVTNYCWCNFLCH